MTIKNLDNISDPFNRISAYATVDQDEFITNSEPTNCPIKSCSVTDTSMGMSKLIFDTSKNDISVGELSNVDTSKNQIIIASGGNKFSLAYNVNNGIEGGWE